MMVRDHCRMDTTAEINHLYDMTPYLSQMSDDAVPLTKSPSNFSSFQRGWVGAEGGGLGGGGCCFVVRWLLKALATC